ncbi:MAG TPA: CPBP family intramembrane glutamic endopeptidase [Polyangiaceae bacterium]|nr:CPBP family intramembrane glutamic endopeptidase [Polyangiaceae bacterium]
MNTVVAAAWALLAFVGLNGLLFASAVLRPESVQDLVHVGLIEALVMLGAGALVLQVHAPGLSLSRALAFRPTTPGLLVLCFAIGLCLRLPADSLRQWVEVVSPTPDEVLLAQSQLLRYDTPGEMIRLFLVLAVVGPLVEELFYRGALFGPLLRARGATNAVITTSIAFVLAHGQWRDFLALLPVALLLGLVRGLTGSLLPAFALHSAFNLSAVWALLFGAASATEPLQVPIWATVAGWVLVFALSGLAGRLALHSELTVAAREDDLQ